MYTLKPPAIFVHKRVYRNAKAVERLERMLEQVLLYARPARVILANLELSAFIKDIVATYDSLARERDQDPVATTTLSALKHSLSPFSCMSFD